VAILPDSPTATSIDELSATEYIVDEPKLGVAACAHVSPSVEVA